MSTATPRYWMFIVAAVLAVMSLGFIAGPFPVQGVLFVVITAVTTWRLGVRPGLVSTALGVGAAHLQRFIATPGLLLHPQAMFDQQYAQGYAAYFTLSAVALLIGARHQRTLALLADTQAHLQVSDREHVAALRATLEREQAARSHSDWFAAIIESSDDMIVGTDVDGTIRSWNKAAEQTFGIPAADAIGQSIDTLVVPDDYRDEEPAVRARLLQGETVLHFETERRRADGSVFPVSLTVSSIRDEAGKLIGISRIARDISGQAEIRRQVSDLQSRLMALLTASQAVLRSPTLSEVVPAILDTAQGLMPADGLALWRFDSDANAWRVAGARGLSDTFTQQVVKVTRRTRLDLLAIPDVASSPSLVTRRAEHEAEGIRALLTVPLTRGEQAIATVAFYYRAPRTFSDIEMESARAFGSLATASLTTAELFDAQLRTARDFQFLADTGVVLTESLDPADTLSRMAQLAVPFFADYCSVGLVQSDGSVEEVALSHIDPAKLEIARKFRLAYPDTTSSASAVGRVLATQEPILIEHLSEQVIRQGTRDEAHVQAILALGVRSAMVVPISVRGRALGTITFARVESTTPYTSADLRLAASVAARAGLVLDSAYAYREATEANRLKDEFLATLSHELRTPLNAVLGYTRMLQTGSVDPARTGRALTIVERNADMLNTLVKDILDTSAIVSGKIVLKHQAVSLLDVLEEAVAAIRPSAAVKSLDVVVTSSGPTPRVAGDPTRLQQVLWNVLTNAVKFTPKNGSISVAVACDTDTVSVTVRDTGRGITPAFLPHVFDRFRQHDQRATQEHGGLGLGLAIAKDLIELQGGHIEASSDGEGHGASFRVVLPRLQDQVPAAPVARC